MNEQDIMDLIKFAKEIPYLKEIYEQLDALPTILSSSLNIIDQIYTDLDMSASTFLVFYRFKSMSTDESQKANSEWHEIKNSLPDGVELVGEYDHAWGTEYNGFLLFEADSSDLFLDWWSKFKDKV